jgi:hypothetical protein
MEISFKTDPWNHNSSYEGDFSGRRRHKWAEARRNTLQDWPSDQAKRQNIQGGVADIKHAVP